MRYLTLSNNQTFAIVMTLAFSLLELISQSAQPQVTVV